MVADVDASVRTLGLRAASHPRRKRDHVRTLLQRLRGRPHQRLRRHDQGGRRRAARRDQALLGMG